MLSPKSSFMGHNKEIYFLKKKKSIKQSKRKGPLKLLWATWGMYLQKFSQ